MSNMGQDHYTASEARKLIREILENGETLFTTHAYEEMYKDRLSEGDLLNVLRGGIVDEAEWEHGSWRHRVHTQNIYVVVSIESIDEQLVITAWKIRRRR